MKNKYTIIEAAKKVLSLTDDSMSVAEIYAQILEKSLYIFHAQDPISVLRGELRSHSVGIDFPTASSKKYFLYDESNRRFRLLGEEKTQIKKGGKEQVSLRTVRELHHEYVDLFQQKILRQLKSLNPYEFEKFCRNLLEVYGFVDLSVTQKSRDGGIDGFGKLKIGLAYMNVAFQCKRWNTGSVSRKEIDAFRGAIQGEYEQGIFFTTSTFTKEAMAYSIKQGAVPIILIDGKMIVDFMIEKQFGIEHENLPIYINALDQVLS
jgi:restriction system protein